MNMQARAENPGDAGLRMSRMIRDARLALEKGNVSYVSALSADWVNRFPEHAGVRLLLWDARSAARDVDTNRASIGMRIRTSVLALMLPGHRGVKKNPGGAILLSDRVLALNPHHRLALLITLEASRALGWLETALMACDKLIECRDHRPQDVVTAADLNLELGRTAEAVRLCESGMLRFPGDPSIRSALRRASVRRSMCSTVRVRNVPTVGG